MRNGKLLCNTCRHERPDHEHLKNFIVEGIPHPTGARAQLEAVIDFKKEIEENYTLATNPQIRMILNRLEKIIEEETQEGAPPFEPEEEPDPEPEETH